MTTPTYWKRLKWTTGWEPADGDELDTGLGGSLEDAEDKNQDAGLQTTWLPTGHIWSRRIRHYLGANIAAVHKSAPRGEETRMSMARSSLDKVREELKSAVAEGEINRLHKQESNLLKTLAEKARRGSRSKPPQPGPAVIHKIKVIRHDVLWEEYCDRKWSLASTVGFDALKRIKWTIDDNIAKLPVLDSTLGEALLLHGTSTDIMKLIAESGFRPDLGRNKNACDVCYGMGKVKGNECGGCHGSGTKLGETALYGALGQGCYFSDNFGKTQTYTSCSACYGFRCACLHPKGHPAEGQPVTRQVMLARVLLGRPHSVRSQPLKTQKLFEQDESNASRRRSFQSIKEGRHSVYGKKRGLYWLERPALFGANEFLIKDRNQIYPEFVVYWHFPMDDVE